MNKLKSVTRASGRLFCVDVFSPWGKCLYLERKGRFFCLRRFLQEDDQKQHALYALHVILLSNNTNLGQMTRKCTVRWIYFLYWFLSTQISIFLHHLSGGKQRCMPHMPCCFLFLMTAIVTVGCLPYLCSGGAYGHLFLFVCRYNAWRHGQNLWVTAKANTNTNTVL